MKKIIFSLVVIVLFLSIVGTAAGPDCPSGMVSYWSFDEGSGTAASDSYSSNSGTINGATWTSGIVGNALSFDGTNDYVEIPYDPSFNLESFTLEAWVKYTQDDVGRIIVRPSGGNPTDGFSFFSMDSTWGKLGGGVQGEGQSYSSSTSTGSSTFNDNNWHLCHFVRDMTADEISVYVDGTFYATYPDSSPGDMEHNYEGIFIGSLEGTDQFFQGAIDEVAIYDGVLTPTEISDHYNNGVAGVGYCGTPEICGNGIVEGSEECDDGNMDEMDGCSSTCTIEFCGDGLVNNLGMEECDDGNNNNGDGCDSACIEEICGNNKLQAGEQCDDGNLQNGDGCSSTCTVEITTCFGIPYDNSAVCSGFGDCIDVDVCDCYAGYTGADCSTPECIPETEVCDGADNDCDGSIDEGLTQSDPSNCGACGIVCSTNNIVVPICTDGLCTGTCDTGFADCNNDKRTDGCEINLNNDPNNCGSCAVVCDIGQTCNAGSCILSCIFNSDCDYSYKCAGLMCLESDCYDAHGSIPEKTCPTGFQCQYADAVDYNHGNGMCLEVPTCIPEPEICDGLDNNCDFKIDEDLGATTCGLGECQRMVQNCIGGVVQTCTPKSPTPEICDSLDNDCDGVVDNSLSCADSDSDGVIDIQDNCPDDYNPNQEDSESVEIPNCHFCSTCPMPPCWCCDGTYWMPTPDGFGDVCDNCPDLPNPSQLDTDNDDVGNGCDNCPNDPNNNQQNSDADLFGGDLYGDVCDNCPTYPNQNQADNDNDGFGNACEDCDNDPNKRWSGVCGCGVADIDTDGDGEEDCIDCDDVLQSTSEEGIDCGGPCSACVDCTWCGSKITPIRVKDEHNSGQIDVVFVPDISYDGNLAQFELDVIEHIHDGYFMIDQWAVDPIPADYKDRFNFYIYNSGFGNNQTCAGTLPTDFWTDASFTDSAGILAQSGAWGCASSLGPPSRWIALTSRRDIVIHESGHSIFGLVDEYCGNTYYEQNDPSPNVWSSNASCQADVAAEGFTLGDCRKIESGACSKNFWRYDPDAPDDDIMTCACWGTPSFYEADTRRLNYIFDNWPAGSTKGILVNFNINNNIITELNSKVVDNHPDLGVQYESFSAEAFSSSEELLVHFGIWDPRIELGEEMVYTDNVDFTIIFAFYDNLKTFEIKDVTTSETLVTVDLTETLQNYCNGNNYQDQECQALDLDNDGILDVDDSCPLDSENDIDDDSICGDVDNCPSTYNPDQSDNDLDGIGDMCDVCPNDAENDIDNDGVCGEVDNCPNTPANFPVDPEGCPTPHENLIIENYPTTVYANDGVISIPVTWNNIPEGDYSVRVELKHNDVDILTEGTWDHIPTADGTYNVNIFVPKGISSDSANFVAMLYPYGEDRWWNRIAWDFTTCCDVKIIIDNDEDGYLADEDCDDNDPNIYPGAEEVCDSKDNDCDEFTDEELGTTTCGLGVCEHTIDNCVDGIPQVCDPFEGASTEICDGLDNDCDGEVDEVDNDNDGLNDCFDDKCMGTTDWSAEELKPNHYESSNMVLTETFGCSCEQILFCKPGNNNGELKFGCTEGTMNVWTTQAGWSLDCQTDGIVTHAGESKGLFEDTDNAGMPDILDGDNDNDGIPDSEDSEPDSKPDQEGKPKGKPDWWCEKHPSKC